MKPTPVTLKQEDKKDKYESALIYRKSGDMLLVILDLDKRYNEVSGIGDNDLFIHHDDPSDSEYLLPAHEPMTHVQFTDIDEEVWFIHMASMSKYTLSVLFIKKEN